jgi:hypothetical protein
MHHIYICEGKRHIQISGGKAMNTEKQVTRRKYNEVVDYALPKAETKSKQETHVHSGYSTFMKRHK